MIRSFPPHPNPLPPGERGGHSSLQQSWGGILPYFYKKIIKDAINILASHCEPGGRGNLVRKYGEEKNDAVSLKVFFTDTDTDTVTDTDCTDTVTDTFTVVERRKKTHQAIPEGQVSGVRDVCCKVF